MAVYQTRLTKLQKAAEEELKDIERERFLNHLKNYGGFALEIGSVFIPAAGGARIVGAITKVLAPKIGLKTAYEIAKGAVSGAMSGGVLGLGDSLINDENPLTTSLRYSLIGALSGGGLGLGSSVIVKNGIKNSILTKTNNNELLENPVINKKPVKGSYNSSEIKHLEKIDEIFSNNHYNLSGHALQRIYERSNTENVLNTLRNGEKYIDAQENLTYFKDGLTVHTDKTTGNIITVIYRGSNAKLPKTWRKYNE